MCATKKSLRCAPNCFHPETCSAGLDCSPTSGPTPSSPSPFTLWHVSLYFSTLIHQVSRDPISAWVQLSLTPVLCSVLPRNGSLWKPNKIHEGQRAFVECLLDLCFIYFSLWGNRLQSYIHVWTLHMRQDTPWHHKSRSMPSGSLTL
jgi:hypothetical protein